MADSTDVLLKFVEIQRTEIHHIETQRSTITNLLLIIVAATIGVFAQKGIDHETWILGSLLLTLGILGIFITLKYYQLYNRAATRLVALTKKIDKLQPDSQVFEIQKSADDKHFESHAILRRFRLHWIWIILYMVIFMAGIGIMIYHLNH